MTTSTIGQRGARGRRARPPVRSGCRAAALALLLATAAVPAQAALTPPETREAIGRIFATEAFQPQAPALIWTADGRALLEVRRDRQTGAPSLVEQDAATGRSRVLATAAQLTPPGAAQPLRIESVQLAPSGDWLLLQAAGQPVARGEELRNVDYWILRLATATLEPAARGVRLMDGYVLFPTRPGPAISPDGRRLAYSNGGALHVFDLASRTDRMLAPGEEPQTYRGSVSWSPDGRRLAFLETDISMIPRRTVLLPTDQTYPSSASLPYARVGGPIPRTRLAVVEADGEGLRRIALPDSAGPHWIWSKLTWAPDGREFLVQHYSRGRDRRTISVVDPVTGAARQVYQESARDYVDTPQRSNTPLIWQPDGRGFLLVSERDGWRRIYRLGRDGRGLRPLSPAGMDLTGFFAGLAPGSGAAELMELRDRDVYFYASPKDATQRYLWRVPLSGGRAAQVTPAGEAGSHRYSIAPGSGLALHEHASFNTPPRLEVVEIATHRPLRVVEDNAALKARVDREFGVSGELLRLRTGRDYELDAYLLKPRDFDPSRKYPLIVWVYGDPYNQNVLDDWHMRQIFFRFLANQGYLVACIDNRGTPGPKGAAWRRAEAGSLGPIAAQDQAEGVRELARLRPYVDLDRVGIWGWSGGGTNTLHSMFRHPDVFSVGVAIAPKSQPKDYDAWFQEAYMKTPQVNPEGYRNATATNFAEGLKGRLLIVHGSGETNTHFEMTESLVDRLIELGKEFDLMVYPRRDHSINEGRGTLPHLYTLVTRYFREHLPPGPR